MTTMTEICVYLITITRTLHLYFICDINFVAVRVLGASSDHRFYNEGNKEKITPTHTNNTHQIESKHIYFK